MTNAVIEKALNILPDVAWLMENGIISVFGYEPKVHCTEEFFRENFAEYKAEPFPLDWKYRLSARVNDTEFYTLSDEQ